MTKWELIGDADFASKLIPEVFFVSTCAEVGCQSHRYLPHT